jgi:hypothetical protein
VFTVWTVITDVVLLLCPSVWRVVRAALPKPVRALLDFLRNCGQKVVDAFEQVGLLRVPLLQGVARKPLDDRRALRKELFEKPKLSTRGQAFVTSASSTPMADVHGVRAPGSEVQIRWPGPKLTRSTIVFARSDAAQSSHTSDPIMAIKPVPSPLTNLRAAFKMGLSDDGSLNPKELSNILCYAKDFINSATDPKALRAGLEKAIGELNANKKDSADNLGFSNGDQLVVFSETGKLNDEIAAMTSYGKKKIADLEKAAVALKAMDGRWKR